MPALALGVIAIALPDSLNPSLIVAAILIAFGEHPFRRTLAFTLSAFVVTLGGGLLIAVGLGDLVISLLPKFSEHTKWDVMIVLGVLLVGGAVVIWWRRDQLAESEPPSRHAAHASGGSSILLGAGIAAAELLTAFPYFAAIAMVVGASVSLPSKVSLLILYNVVYALPLIAIVAVCGFSDAEHRQRLAPIGDWIAMRWPVVVAPLVACAGIALTTYGAVQLA